MIDIETIGRNLGAKFGRHDTWDARSSVIYFPVQNSGSISWLDSTGNLSIRSSIFRYYIFELIYKGVRP